MNKNEAITPFQLFAITLFSMMFGLNIYPSTIGHDISHEWFIAQLISVILIFPILFMLLSIFNSSECTSFEDTVFGIAGNIPARVLGLFFSIYFLLHSLRIILLEANDIQLFLFDKTPLRVIAIVIAIVAFILSFSGTQPLAKLAELLALPIVLLIIFMLAMFFSASDFGEIKTLFQPEPNNIFSQVVKNVTCFSCIEMTAFFICKVENKKRRKIALISGYSFCAVTLLFLTLCIVGTFTLNAGADLIYPVTELARTVQLEFLRVIERFDIVILSVNIASASVFSSIACYCSASSLSMVFSPLKFRYSLSIYLALFLLIFFGFEERFLNVISSILLYCEAAVLLVIIPGLFVLSIVRRKGTALCESKD